MNVAMFKKVVFDKQFKFDVLAFLVLPVLVLSLSFESHHSQGTY